jgi:molybdopterin converting factor small subunit
MGSDAPVEPVHAERMDTTISVRVRLFAGHRERVGASTVDITLHSDATVADALAVLTDSFPDLTPTLRFTSFAVNRQVVDDHSVLHDADELALLQPVSGG